MEWIKVEDRLPDTEDVYLIWPEDKYAGNVAGFYPYSSFKPFKMNTFYIESEHGEVTILDGITHWCKIIGPVV